MIYLQLIFEFAKIGLFAIGGGLATIPFLTQLAEKTNWYTVGELADMIAVSESTPGPIGINMATFAGYKTAGVPGAAAATLGLIIPALVIMIIVAKLLTSYSNSKTVDRAFYGLRPASVALISAAGIALAKISLVSIDAFKASGAVADLFMYKSIILAAVLIFLTRKYKLPLVASIVISAVCGIIFKFAA